MFPIRTHMKLLIKQSQFYDLTIIIKPPVKCTYIFYNNHIIYRKNSKFQIICVPNLNLIIVISFNANEKYNKQSKLSLCKVKIDRQMNILLAYIYSCNTGGPKNLLQHMGKACETFSLIQHLYSVDVDIILSGGGSEQLYSLWCIPQSSLMLLYEDIHILCYRHVHISVYVVRFTCNGRAQWVHYMV